MCFITWIIISLDVFEVMVDMNECTQSMFRYAVQMKACQETFLILYHHSKHNASVNSVQPVINMLENQDFSRWHYNSILTCRFVMRSQPFSVCLHRFYTSLSPSPFFICVEVLASLTYCKLPHSSESEI